MASQRYWFLVIFGCGLFVSGWPSLQQVALAQPAADAAPTAPADTGWPRTHEKDGQTVVIYQPQVDEWKDQKSISFRAATAVTPRGATEPVYGVIKAHADTIVDRESRNVYMVNMQADVNFPGKNEQETKDLHAMVNEVMLGNGDMLTVSLDRVLACVAASEAAAVKPVTVDINLDPPPIYWSQTPAILVIFGGTPQFKPIAGTRLTFAVNTNWDVVQDQASSKFYLLDGDSWLTAVDPVKGPWTAAAQGSLPADLYNLPTDANWAEISKHVPGTVATSAPKVFASTVPAELIVTQGQPEASPIPGTALEQVVNPQMPLFYDKTDQNYYFLVAGRWFKTKDFNGDWSAASAQLPDDFAKIPYDSEAGEVLPSVPGTEEAKEAVMLAAIPHKATVNISQATVNVVYDGTPKFAPITGTTMTYAVNTPNQVILANANYYCCYQGVWFIAPAATGPWAVCTSVAPVIYTIPPTSPVYNVTYVQVYSATPSTVVVGYTAGYSGEYVAATGALMFGAGVAVGAIIANNSDHYYPYPAPYYSYGSSAFYSYGYGGYHTSAAYYGPYGGAGYSASYNAATGTYSRSAAAYGAYGGSASVHQAYNPYTGTAASHSTASNGYESWGHSTAVAQNGDWASAGHQTNANGSSSGWAETSSGKGGNAYQTAGGATVAKTNNGNVYAADNGKTYSSNGQYNTNEAKSGSGSGSGESYNGKNGSAYQTQGGADVAKSNNGETYAAKDGKTASGSEETNANGSKSASAEGSDGKGGSAYQTKGGADVGKTNSGDVYAGKDGNVYKKSDSGDWQQHTSSGWQNASKDDSSKMDSEAESRSRGNYQASRSGGGWGGGGGFRGGGGGRRR